MEDKTKIAGKKTVLDWKNLRKKLLDAPNDKELWEQAFSLLALRLATRYFRPIKRIKCFDKYNGEGFAIVTILCSLIEFLETICTGEIYRYCKDGELDKAKFEYNNSKEKIVSFLEKRKPFKDVFTKENKLAPEFYKNVRCGLLHEAQTRGDWIIRADNKLNFYEFREKNHVIDRNLFEKAIKDYLKGYKTSLLTDQALQEAFIRKMNNMAGLEYDFTE